MSSIPFSFGATYSGNTNDNIIITDLSGNPLNLNNIGSGAYGVKIKKTTGSGNVELKHTPAGSGSWGILFWEDEGFTGSDTAHVDPNDWSNSHTTTFYFEKVA